MKSLLSLIRNQPLIAFVISTYTISWSLWYLAGAYSTVTTEFQPLGWRWLLTQMGVYAPAVVGAAIMALVPGGEAVRRPLVGMACGLVLLIGIALSRVNYSEIFTNNILQIGVIGVATVAVVVFTRNSTGFGSGLSSRGGVGMGWLLASIFLIPALMAVSMLVADRKITISPALFQAGSPLRLLFFAVSLFAFNLILGGSLGEEPVGGILCCRGCWRIIVHW